MNGRPQVPPPPAGNGGPCAPHRPHAPAPDGRQNLILLAVPVILCAHLIYDKHKGKSS